MPKISIIIPVFNVENYLKKCIDSVISSSFKMMEIILVNDGSNDNSPQICNQYAAKDSRVRVIHQKNRGLSVARNTGIDFAKGDYILFLDSDDWVDFNIIVNLLNYAVFHKLDVLSFGLEYFNEHYTSLGIRPPYKHIPYNRIITGFEALDYGYQPSSSCLFIYNTFFLNINKLRFVPKITHQDVEFTMRIMIKAERVLFSNKIAYKYFRRLGSISLAKNKEGLYKYIEDEVIVADLIKKNLDSTIDKKQKNIIQKNYNSVVWNLLWRFYKNPKETDIEFKRYCIKKLKNNKLYPIKGPLKTPFQEIIKYFFYIKYYFI